MPTSLIGIPIAGGVTYGMEETVAVYSLRIDSSMYLKEAKSRWRGRGMARSRSVPLIKTGMSILSPRASFVFRSRRPYVSPCNCFADELCCMREVGRQEKESLLRSMPPRLAPARGNWSSRKVVAVVGGLRASNLSLNPAFSQWWKQMKGPTFRANNGDRLASLLVLFLASLRPVFATYRISTGRPYPQCPFVAVFPTAANDDAPAAIARQETKCGVAISRAASADPVYRSGTVVWS